MAESSPERSVFSPSKCPDGLLVSPESIYRKRATRPIVSQTQRVRSSVSPVSSRRGHGQVRFANKDCYRTDAGRHMSPPYSGRWDVSLSMIEEKRSTGKKRHAKRFPTVIEEGLITVKGMSPAVCMSTFSPLLLSSVIMRKSLVPPRITAYSSLVKKVTVPTALTSAYHKRYSTASPQKRRPVRPKTSHLDWDMTPNRQHEETFDEVAAWD